MDNTEVNRIINDLGVKLSSTTSTIDVVRGDIDQFRKQVCFYCSKKDNLVGDRNPKRCYTGFNQAGLCTDVALQSYLA